MDHELAFISDNLRYPDYCTLNLCRIIRSFEEKNVVRSKHGRGRWASKRYAQWEGLIQAAIRSYANTASDADNALLRDQVVPFHQFALDEIRRIRDVDSAFDFLDPGELVDGDLELIHQALGDPSRGHVPFYRFSMCVNGTIDAGTLARKIGETRSVTHYREQIGYEVFPSHRGHRYAAQSCSLIRPFVRAHGLDQVWITVDPENTASRPTFELAGAEPSM